MVCFVRAVVSRGGKGSLAMSPSPRTRVSRSNVPPIPKLKLYWSCRCGRYPIMSPKPTASMTRDPGATVRNGPQLHRCSSHRSIQRCISGMNRTRSLRSLSMRTMPFTTVTESTRRGPRLCVHPRPSPNPRLWNSHGRCSSAGGDSSVRSVAGVTGGAAPRSVGGLLALSCGVGTVRTGVSVVAVGGADGGDVGSPAGMN